MKTITLIAVSLISLSSFATTLKCEAYYNLNPVFSAKVDVSDREQNVRFGDYEEYEFFVSDKGNNVFELQALHVIEPSRSYSTAKLTKDSPSMTLTIWKRESILDLTCSL